MSADSRAVPGDDGIVPAPHVDRPLAVVTRWWFWLGLLLVLWMFPLIKSLGAEFPEPLRGMRGEPIDFELPDEQGELVALHEMRGDLVLIAELPLANRTEAELTLERMRRLRKRMRGLGSGVIYLSLAHGGPVSDLTDLLDAGTERAKPVNAFLMDEDRAIMSWLRREAGSERADVFLLDRHGRVRGIYGRRPDEVLMSDAEVDRLVQETGQLANWVGQDPEPGRVDEVLGEG